MATREEVLQAVQNMYDNGHGVIDGRSVNQVMELLERDGQSTGVKDVFSLITIRDGKIMTAQGPVVFFDTRALEQGMLTPIIQLGTAQQPGTRADIITASIETNPALRTLPQTTDQQATSRYV